MKNPAILSVIFFSLVFNPLFSQDVVQFHEGGWEALNSCAKCVPCGDDRSGRVETVKAFSFYCGEKEISVWYLIKGELADCDSIYWRTLSKDDFNIGGSEFRNAEHALADIFREVKKQCPSGREILRRESPHSEYALNVIRDFFTPVELESDPFYVKPSRTAEVMPVFKGCEGITDAAGRQECTDKQFLIFIYKNIKYPVEARSNGIGGAVVAEFVIEKDGFVSYIDIVQDIGGGCGEEVAGVLERLNAKGPSWIPAKNKGAPVRILYSVPVKFRLE
jgi:hypothetical protein